MKQTISAKEFQESFGKKKPHAKNQYSHIKAGWRTIGGIKAYFRSGYEANYARYLQLLKERKMIIDWLHEPETFWFKKIERGARSYLPDFKVIQLDGTHLWYEVKGHYDAKSLTKIKRFRKYYPEEKIELIDSDFFEKHNQMLNLLIRGWE